MKIHQVGIGVRFKALQSAALYEVSCDEEEQNDTIRRKSRKANGQALYNTMTQTDVKFRLPIHKYSSSFIVSPPKASTASTKLLVALLAAATAVLAALPVHVEVQTCSACRCTDG